MSHAAEAPALLVDNRVGDTPTAAGCGHQTELFSFLFIMAKGNMFQGMARGKVGDVVFSRLNGQQVSRVRNRNPRNPRTNSQLYQRAVMATVMQAYSAGKEIFDHAFQGESVGAHNMAKFMKMNADKLRSQLAADLANTPISLEEKVGRFVGPNSNTPTPYSYIVSDGGYAQTLFTFDMENNVFKIAAPTSGEKVQEYAARLGLIAGDIYTIVAFVPTSTTPAFIGPGEGGVVVDQQINVVYPTQFRFCRLMVKTGLASVTDVLATYDQLFEPDPLNKYMTDLTQVAITAGLNLGTLAGGVIADTIGGTMGVIRSRRDQDVRSHTELEFIPGDNSATPYPWGLTYDYLLAAWTMGATKVGDSSLLLEGSGF